MSVSAFVRLIIKCFTRLLYISKLCVGSFRCMMVSHKRLQHYKHHYGTVCVTGVLGCRWHRYQQSMEKWTKCDVAWFLVLVAALMYVTFWLYFYIVGENSIDIINWYWYNNFGKLDIFLVFQILTCLTFAYLVVLTVLTLCHMCFGHQVYIHWLHRSLILITLVGCVAIMIAIEMLWSGGWQLMNASLQMTGPFLHICLVVVMTSLTWFIAGQCLIISSRVWQTMVIVAYVAVMLALYIFPPFLDTPCVLDSSQLPPKPLLTAHRGGAAVAPENTVIAFKYAATNYSAYTLESDLAISLDGVPFMLHDDDLRRTTNIDSVFPDRASNPACSFNFSDISQLNAGSWFIKDDPFRTVGGQKSHDKTLYKNQTVATFAEYLQIAVETDTNVLFDMKSGLEECEDHPYAASFINVYMDAIDQSGIDKRKVFWLYSSLDYGDSRTDNLTAIAPWRLADLAYLKDENISHVNTDFEHHTTSDIKEFLHHNVSVNMYTVDAPWLFSLYWCTGVTSITTNQVSLMSDLTSPVWVLTKREFLIIWLVTDLVSAIACIAIWLLQKQRNENNGSFDIRHDLSTGSLQSPTSLSSIEDKPTN